MARWVEAIDAEPENLVLIPKIHVVEGKNSLKLSSDL